MQKFFDPVAAGGEFGARRRIAVREFLQEPHGAEREAVREMRAFALAQNEFRAAAANVQQQQRRLGQFRVGGHALKHPRGLLPAGNDFHLQFRCRFDGGNQIVGIDRVARGAGSDDADGPGVVLACRSRKIGDGIGGMGDGLRLQPAGFVKAPARRVCRLSSCTGRTSCPATSATNNLIELVPTSMTARRTGSTGHQTTRRDWEIPSEKMLHFCVVGR